MKASDLMTRLDFLEWLILHPKAEEIGPPYTPNGWFMAIDDSLDKLFVEVMNRDGRNFSVMATRSPRPFHSAVDEVRKYIMREWPNDMG